MSSRVSLLDRVRDLVKTSANINLNNHELQDDRLVRNEIRSSFTKALFKSRFFTVPIVDIDLELAQNSDRFTNTLRFGTDKDMLYVRVRSAQLHAGKLVVKASYYVSFTAA